MNEEFKDMDLNPYQRMTISALHSPRDKASALVPFITLDQWNAMPVHLREAVQMSTSQIAKIKTVDELIERVRFMVRVNSFNARPTSVVHLNRIFGRVAHRLKISLTEIILDLTADETFTSYPYTKGQAVMDRKVRDAAVSMLSADGGGPAEIEKAMRSWAANTV